MDESGAAAGDVHHLAHQVGVDLLDEVFQVQVQIIHATAQLAGVVVAQVFRCQVFQIGAGLDEGAAGLGHLLPVDGQVAVHVHPGGLAEAGAFQHGRPEQGVEVDDVLADEVVQLGGGVLAPEGIEVQLRATGAEILEAGHVADRRVQPDVEILARLAGDFEAEVGRITTDIPLLQPGIQPFGDLVGHGILQGAAAGPFLQHVLEVGQGEEEVLGILQHRGRAGDGRARVFQFGRLVGGTALLAVVTVLVLGGAPRAGALDEAVGQEHALFRVEVLRHRTGADVTVGLELLVDQLGQLAVLFGMGGVVVVEIHQKVGKVGGVLGLDRVDQLLGRDAFLLRAQHDGRAMGVIGADVDALMAAQLLEADPDVGLDVFQHMPQMDRTVGIGQGAGNENLTFGLVAGHGHSASVG